MSAVSWCVGGIFTIAGVGKVLDLVDKSDLYLKKGPVGESRCQKITRLAANALRVISSFALAVGSLTMAHVLFSVGPQIGFLSSFLYALNFALPSLGMGFGGLLAAETIQILGN